MSCLLIYSMLTVIVTKNGYMLFNSDTTKLDTVN